MFLKHVYLSIHLCSGQVPVHVFGNQLVCSARLKYSIQSSKHVIFFMPLAVTLQSFVNRRFPHPLF